MCVEGLLLDFVLGLFGTPALHFHKCVLYCTLLFDELKITNADLRGWKLETACSVDGKQEKLILIWRQ